MRSVALVFLVCACATSLALAQTEKEMTEQRDRMVDRQIEKRGIENPRVLQALRDVKRHLFVEPEDISSAYDDHPLPIGHGQTISQPYIVALMTESIDPQPPDRVLEIGTGSGYQAAVLSRLVANVYTIEIVEELGEEAKGRLERLGYQNVTVKIGDGYKGWPEHAPFDKIVVTAAPPEVPPALVDQLAPGGRMVIPVGTTFQELLLVEKANDGRVSKRVITGVRFVPMVKGKDDSKQ